MKTKTLEKIERKLVNVTDTPVRHHALECAKNFKLSWINLGRALFTVWRDKLYKEWGYSTYEAYVTKEIGIRKQTSLKLLRSYHFLEKEEPSYLSEDYAQKSNVSSMPSYEAVDVLRQAKNKKTLDEDDYVSFKEKVFLKGKDAKEVRRDLTSLIRERQELEPEEAWRQKKRTNIRRIVGTLKSLNNEASASRVLPKSTLNKITSLISEIENQIK